MKKTIRRLAALLLALLLTLTLAGCELDEMLSALDGADLESALQLIEDEPEENAGAAPAQSAQAPPAQTPALAEEPAQAAATATPRATQTPAPTASATPEPTPTASPAPEPAPTETLPEDGEYDSKEDVALYIHLYGHLPGNYITKKQAEALGWTGGSLERYAPGKCIGGSRFGNYEGLLPEKKGRSYTECDIDTLGKSSRGAKRIVFSNDGLIYYTDDHYNSFELLYGEE